MTLAPDLLTLARARVDGRARPPVGCRAVNGRLGRGSKQRVPKPDQAGQSRSKPGPSQVQAGQNQDKAVECMPYVCRMSLGLKTRVASISASISGESARTADLPALSAHVSAQVRSSPLKSAGSLARSLGHRAAQRIGCSSDHGSPMNKKSHGSHTFHLHLKWVGGAGWGGGKFNLRRNRAAPGGERCGTLRVVY